MAEPGLNRRPARRERTDTSSQHAEEIDVGKLILIGLVILAVYLMRRFRK